ncbi:MAG TPA: DUF2127 domain-containing protein [Fimbriimonadaceae bacterium]
MKLNTTALFDIGLILKGIDSVFEVVGGVLLLSPIKLSGYLELLSQHSRHDFIARGLESISHGVQAVTLATAIYLMVHGLAKAILILAVWRDKIWGYVGLMGVLTLFAIVEFYRYFVVYKPELIVLAIFDAFLVAIIAREYKIRHKKPASVAS